MASNQQSTQGDEITRVDRRTGVWVSPRGQRAWMNSASQLAYGTLTESVLREAFSAEEPKTQAIPKPTDKEREKSQETIQEILKTDPSLLYGEKVYLEGYEMQITSLLNVEDLPHLRRDVEVRYQRPDLTEYSDHKELSQLTLIGEVNIPTIQESRKFLKQKFAATIEEATELNLKKNEEKILAAKRQVLLLKREIVHKQEYAKQQEQALEQLKKNPHSLSRFLTDLGEIKTHPLVEDAYISTGGRVIVLTKMLHKQARTSGKVTKEEMGKFKLIYDYRKLDCPAFKAFNLTYEWDSYDHPNISAGTICTGGNSEEMQQMLRNFQIVELTDFLIVFCSTLHHRGGGNDPYTDPYEWMDGKHKRQEEVFIDKKAL